MFEQIWQSFCDCHGHVKSLVSLSGQRLDFPTQLSSDAALGCWTRGLVCARRTAGVDDQVIRRLILDGAAHALEHLEEAKGTQQVTLRPGTNIPEDCSELCDESTQYMLLISAFELDSQNPEVREHVLGIVRGALDEMLRAHQQTVGA